LTTSNESSCIRSGMLSCWFVMRSTYGGELAVGEGPTTSCQETTFLPSARVRNPNAIPAQGIADYYDVAGDRAVVHRSPGRDRDSRHSSRGICCPRGGHCGKSSDRPGG